MGDILIRNLDEGVIDALKVRAKSNGRSLQAELHEEITRLVDGDIERRRAERRRFVMLAEEIARSADKSKMDKDAWELIREDRDQP
ncbi:MAG: hypothetical protein AAF360_20095 [Pseudomonadota bacterium]